MEEKTANVELPKDAEGRVFVCEKGKPPMREIEYHCGNCHSTVIFPKKYEPEGVGNDR